MRRLTHPRFKLTAIICATIFAVASSALAKDGEIRSCETKLGGQVVCGDLIIGITFEQYKADLEGRAKQIRSEEAEKRAQLQKLLELTERATSAEKDSLRSQIAALEAEKQALAAEGKGVADRLTNLQASYDELVQKLAEANATLKAFAPLISKDAFEQAQAMLSRGDVLGAERKFDEIADAVHKIGEQVAVAEARAAFQAGQLAYQRIDWRKAYADYARAASLQPSNLRYAERAGSLALETGNYAAATSFAEVALNISASAFGPDAPETAAALNNLAATYEEVGRYAEAEFLYRRAIEIGQKTLGTDSPAVATGYSNLAISLMGQGRYTEAELFFRAAIEIDEKALVKDHPDVANRYANFAGLLDAQGKYGEAEPLFRRAIDIGEKSLGKDHPNVAVWYNNLAYSLAHQGRYAEAEPLYRRVMEIDEKAFGKDHPDVAAACQNLALVLQRQGKYGEAESLLRRAIEIDEKALGQDHPDVAIAYDHLGTLLRDQGKYAEAEPVLRRAFEIFQASFGPDHPNTLRAKSDYDSLRQPNNQSLNSAQ
jgi:tetratricopeptide (TPR) repeat protein